VQVLTGRLYRELTSTLFKQNEEFQDKGGKSPSVPSVRGTARTLLKLPTEEKTSILYKKDEEKIGY